uniref:Cell growth-regulating nucleolar protein n=1 Tax=Electrophorus electricus TaxID=8005 RepID=A0A4W4HAT4_ELEEL
MVFFTCNACGESLKKSQVDKHVSVCRACQVLSCIDCGKDFWGDDYKSHVKCISEDQKYGGKGYEAKANKGVIKQQQWIQIIQEAINKPDINPKLKDVLSQVTSYENVPRKKAKFQNWMKNSLRIFNCDLQDQVWEIFSAAISSATNQQQPKAKSATETSKEPCHPPHSHTMQEVEEQVKERKKNKRERKEERQKKNKKKQTEYNSKEEEKNGEIASAERQKKKRKREAEQHVEDKKTNKLKKHKREEPEGNHQFLCVIPSFCPEGKFNWKGTIKAILQQSPPEGLTIKRLRKKVLAAYYSFCKDGNYKSEEQLFSLFNKKLNNPKFKILKDKVRLVK